MKFLEKPEAQPDLPLASHERPGEGEGTFAPPSTTHPEPCAEKASHDDVSVEFDPANSVDSALAPSLYIQNRPPHVQKNIWGRGRKTKNRAKKWNL